MYLKQLHLKHFRNYTDQRVVFGAPKTIVVGHNAQGKSNLLESVQFLATLRSHRVSRDRDLVRDGAALGEITALCERGGVPLELSVRLRLGGKRSLAVNGASVPRHLDFLGQFHAVSFSSLDLDLVRGAPEARRTWLDSVLIQLEPIAANILQQFNQVLRQRNALLRGIRQGTMAPDPEQMAAWDAQLAVVATHLLRRRSRLVSRLAPLAETWHRAIGGGAEALEMTYLSAVNFAETDPPEQVRLAFLERLQQRAIAERQQGTTLVGPHRDDIGFTIERFPAREYGSQGQQRTLVLALKLAELELLETSWGEPPLLLLDDVLAELDLLRQNHLLGAIRDRVQTIVTTTHLGAFDAGWLQSAEILRVESGRVVA